MPAAACNIRRTNAAAPVQGPSYRVRIQLRVSKPLIYLEMWTLVFRILFHFFRPGWAVLA